MTISTVTVVCIALLGILLFLLGANVTRHRALRGAERAHTVVNSSGPKSCLCQCKTCSLVSQQVCHRHFHVFKENLAVPVLIMPTKDWHISNNGHTGGINGHQNH